MKKNKIIILLVLAFLTVGCGKNSSTNTKEGEVTLPGVHKTPQSITIKR